MNAVTIFFHVLATNLREDSEVSQTTPRDPRRRGRSVAEGHGSSEVEKLRVQEIRSHLAVAYEHYGCTIDSIDRTAIARDGAAGWPMDTKSTSCGERGTEDRREREREISEKSLAG